MTGTTPPANDTSDAPPANGTSDETRSDATRRTFEGIDWERVDAERGPAITRWAAAEALALVGLVALLGYDALVVADGEPTVDVPGALTWDVTGVQWLFALVLVVGVARVGRLLTRRPRMAARYWRQFRRNRAAVASLWFLLAVFAVGLVGPLVWKNPNELLDFGRAYRKPVVAGGSWTYPLGTDAQGRPLWNLVVYGMRVSMVVGVTATFIAVTLGTVVGSVAAHFGGYVDEVLMRYVDLQQTFPVFVLLLFLLYLYGPSLLLVVVLYGAFGWEGIGRLVRSEALQRSEAGYVDAAAAAGASRWWVVRRHVIPNVSGTVITAATLAVPTFVLGEATLAFLGFTDPDVFSWGRTIAAGRGDLATAWWVSTVPGVFLFLTVMAFFFVGDALNDAMDPRRER